MRTSTFGTSASRTIDAINFTKPSACLPPVTAARLPVSLLPVSEPWRSCWLRRTCQKCFTASVRALSTSIIVDVIELERLRTVSAYPFRCAREQRQNSGDQLRYRYCCAPILLRQHSLCRCP